MNAPSLFGMMKGEGAVRARDDLIRRKFPEGG